MNAHVIVGVSGSLVPSRVKTANARAQVSTLVVRQLAGGKHDTVVDAGGSVIGKRPPTRQCSR